VVLATLAGQLMEE